MQNNVQARKFTPVPITEENLYEIATKVAIAVVKWLIKKLDMDHLVKLKRGFPELTHPLFDGTIDTLKTLDDSYIEKVLEKLEKLTNNATRDLIQVAAASLWEYRADLKVAYSEAFKEVRQYISNEYKLRQKTYHEPFYHDLLLIRKLLKGEKPKASKKRLERLEQIITKKGITDQNIESIIAVEKAKGKKSFQSVTMLFSDYFTHHNDELDNDNNVINNNIVDPNDRIDALVEEMSPSEYTKFVEKINNALKSPQQMQIIEYRTLNFTNKEISEIMGITEGRVSQHVTRIIKIVKNLLPDETRHYKIKNRIQH